MSDYTTSSGFEKPISGTQAGTWGGTVNTNMDLVDEAINGIVTITLTAAGTTGSPNTMQIVDGATSPARHAFIEVDDNSFGTSQEVYLQLTETGGTVDAERICWIKNSMSSGNDLHLFQGTWGVAREYIVSQGNTCLVRFTGGASVTTCFVYNVLDNTYVDGTFQAEGNITGANLSGTNTGDNPGVTSVDTSGALTGGPITDTGTITHLNTNGYKHIPSDGSSGEFVKWSAAGSGTWAVITTTDVSGYQTPAMYDNGGTPTLTAGITAAEYRTAIGAGTSDTDGTVTQVDGGSGLTGSVTTSGSLAVGPGQGIVVNTNDVALDYAGTNNFINVATDLEGTAIDVLDSIIYHDATDNNIKKGLISDLPGVGESGVTAVSSGNGMDFTQITSTGTVTLGTPSSISDTSTNSVTATSHTHAVSHTGTGNFVMAASPTLTGNPLAPTQAVGNNSTRIATTAFVNAEIANDAPLKDGTGATGTWPISITGSAASASTATSADTATTAVTVTGASQTAITDVGTLVDLAVTGFIRTHSYIQIKERAAAAADLAQYGQIWVKTATPNQLWFTDDAGNDVRLDNAAGGGTVTSVTGGAGLTGTVTSSGNIDVDYAGSDNVIMITSDAGSSLSTSDWLLYSDNTDDGVHRCQVSDLPFSNNSGDISTVTVNAGNGLTGGGTDGTDPVSLTITMGTPGTCTGATSNATTASSHTHAITFPTPTDITVNGTTADTSMYPALFTGASGDLAPYTDAGITYNASTNALTVTGEVSAATFNATSAREKKNLISRMVNPDSLRMISQQGITYSLKDDPDNRPAIGYFADEVAPYFPEVVFFDESGEPAGIDYSRLVVPLIEKVIELEDRLEYLED